jgi:Leucine-rich repeat (LRR) protein
MRELDISFTAIGGPWRFSRSLESLTLGGDKVEELEGLDSALLELRLEKVSQLRSSAGMPSSLQALSISGAKLESLVGVPPRLKELSLSDTQIGVLKELPPTLQRLTLVQNPNLEVGLPHSLLSLTLSGDYRKVYGLDDLAFLSELSARNPSLKALPPFLRRLRVQAFGPWIATPPPSLKAIEVVGAIVKSLPDFSSRITLPRNLEDIRWVGVESLGALPSGLRRLNIASAQLASLEGLPQALESLDISGTSFKLNQVPRDVRDLTFRFFPENKIIKLSSILPNLRSLNVAGAGNLRMIRDIPAALESLDISETCISRLPALPSTLKELDISGTSVHRLENLREGLQSLTVHAGQLSSLFGLPKSVSRLYFVADRSRVCT